MDPKKKLAQLDGLVADLIIGQNRLIEDVSVLKEQVKQLVDFQRQSLDFQRQSLDFQRQSFDFQRQSVDFQQKMGMQLEGIHDFLRQIAGDFQDLRTENKLLTDHETRLRTLESILLKAS